MGSNAPLVATLPAPGRPPAAPRADAGEADAQPVTVDVADLYDRMFVPLTRLAALVTGRPAIAEELAQEAFVRLFPRLDRVRNPEAYLRTMVVNGARSHLRRLAVEVRYLARHGTGDDGAPATPHELFDALAVLRPAERAAIVLRYYEDLPDEEIAATLGCRPATVRSHLHRGLARLREVIDRG